MSYPNYPQQYQPYPQYPQQNYPPNYYPQPEPQVVYEERRRSRWDDPNTREALCDEQCCCCCIPCVLPRFGRRY
ncbi:hypothetical protein M3Y94_00994800 [Aphelenchoides besseyi]|nr:hypothetical protein M3Y94_00994800 [Aphelenchoides besseyi]